LCSRRLLHSVKLNHSISILSNCKYHVRWSATMSDENKGLTSPAGDTEQVADWKRRAPYVKQDDHDFGSVKWQAQCDCGTVRYELSREAPLSSKFCHCRGCQKRHSAPFQWASIFQKKDIRFTNGVDSLEFYKSKRKEKEPDLPCKVYCSNCNGAIMDEGRNMCMVFPELINFDPGEGRKIFDVKNHLFYPDRVIDIVDGKPKWSGLDEQSERLDDRGNPLKSN